MLVKMWKAEPLQPNQTNKQTEGGGAVVYEI